MSWLVLEGSALLFDWCEPLSVLGHGRVVAEFLVWSTLAMESMVSLSTVKVPGNACRVSGVVYSHTPYSG